MDMMCTVIIQTVYFNSTFSQLLYCIYLQHSTTNVLKVAIQLELSTKRKNLQSAIPRQNPVYSCFCQSESHFSEDNFGLCPAPPNVPFWGLKGQDSDQWNLDQWGGKTDQGTIQWEWGRTLTTAPFPSSLPLLAGEGGKFTRLHWSIWLRPNIRSWTLG